jgi:hypothetical protein
VSTFYRNDRKKRQKANLPKSPRSEKTKHLKSAGLGSSGKRKRRKPNSRLRCQVIVRGMVIVLRGEKTAIRERITIEPGSGRGVVTKFIVAIRVATEIENVRGVPAAMTVEANKTETVIDMSVEIEVENG